MTSPIVCTICEPAAIADKIETFHGENHEPGSSWRGLSALPVERLPVHHWPFAVSVRGREAVQVSAGADVRGGYAALAVRCCRNARIDTRRNVDAGPAVPDSGLRSVRRDGVRVFHRTFSGELLSAAQRRDAGDHALF